MLKLVERDFFRSAIKLSAVSSGPQGVSPEVQVLRVGKFSHPKYGEFEITRAVLAEMKKNFEAGIRGVDIAVDYFHKSDEEAAGWFRELFLQENGDELWANIDWTNEASKKLAEREIRYFSPDFAFQWTDPETQKTFNNVLFGGGLTNRPFVKDMAAIVASETKGEKMNEAEIKALLEAQKKEFDAQILKLAEENKDLKKQVEADQLATKAHLDKLAPPAAAPAPVVAADTAAAPAEPDEDDLPTLKKKLAEMSAKCAEYEEKMKTSEAAKQMAEKETAFNLLLSEGKACAAQKDSFLKGDMAAYAKLSQPVNLNPKGSNANPSGAEDREERVLKLAEDKIKADPKLSKIDAISIANREVK